MRKNYLLRIDAARNLRIGRVVVVVVRSFRQKVPTPSRQAVRSRPTVATERMTLFWDPHRSRRRVSIQVLGVPTRSVDQISRVFTNATSNDSRKTWVTKL